ncbi:uncharacterized protein LOC114298923, partial [Camellia sinensis]|uniref:uncharacterized protein LOC114298923 n=1 Tax=Camellia sinensis TaxID=4442 RepID=UPI001035EFDB
TYYHPTSRGSPIASLSVSNSWSFRSQSRDDHRRALSYGFLLGVEGGSSSRNRFSALLSDFISSGRKQRRGLAGATDHHGPPRVNFWQNPMSPSKWKEEHFVIVSLSGWGLLFFGGYKLFSGGKKDEEEKLVEASH